MILNQLGLSNTYLLATLPTVTNALDNDYMKWVKTEYSVPSYTFPNLNNYWHHGCSLTVIYLVAAKKIYFGSCAVEKWVVSSYSVIITSETNPLSYSQNQSEILSHGDIFIYHTIYRNIISMRKLICKWYKRWTLKSMWRLHDCFCWF